MRRAPAAAFAGATQSVSFSAGLPARAACAAGVRARPSRARAGRAARCLSVGPKGGADAGGQAAGGVAVRRGEVGDVGAVAEVVARAFYETGAAGWWAEAVVRKLLERASRAEVGRQLGRRVGRGGGGRGHAVLVAEAGGEVIGCVEVGLVDVPRLLRGGALDEVRQWEEGREDGAPYLGNLAVAAAARRRGVGSRLVQAARELARAEWGKGEVCLHVDAGNEAAKRLYARLGFSCVLREPEWYRRVGREQRMFLRGEAGAARVDAARVAEVLRGWDAARTAARPMNALEYLRYCWADLGERRRRAEGGGRER